jgi:hypothetical protein
METSAMYALGRFRGVRVCNLLVISDELWQAWRPAFRTPELHAADELAPRRLALPGRQIVGHRRRINARGMCAD